MGSFISNVNLIANNIDSLIGLQDLSHELQAIYGQTLDVKGETNRIKEETENVRNRTEEIRQETQDIASSVGATATSVRQSVSEAITYKNQAQEYANVASGILPQLNSVLGRANQDMSSAVRDAIAAKDMAEMFCNKTIDNLNQVDSSNELASLSSNLYVSYILSSNTQKGDIIEPIGLSYYVGKNMLLVSVNGSVLRKSVDYSEYGNDGAISHRIILLKVFPAGTTVDIWIVGSNLNTAVDEKMEQLMKLRGDTQKARNEAVEAVENLQGIANSAQEVLDVKAEAESLLQDTNELKKEITSIGNVVRNQVVEATNQADRAVQAVVSAEEVYSRVVETSKQVATSFQCTSIEDDTHTAIPLFDCLFFYTVDPKATIVNGGINIRPNEHNYTVCQKVQEAFRVE